MTTRTSSRSNDFRTNGKIQPFEWLTSPESIGGFVREHVLEWNNARADDNHNHNDTNNDNNDNNNNNKFSRANGNRNHHNSSKPRAMHIGCGSSTVGEYLVRQLGFGKVVNVDRDRETLEGMEERWRELNEDHNLNQNLNGESNSQQQQQQQQQDDDNKDHTNNDFCRIRTPDLAPDACSPGEEEPMEFWCLDYTTERLPGSYGRSFDLVVDKSTLDCTLCSDCSATASFLAEIYRTLKPGGVYLLVSFHEAELVLPLVEDLPGADWETVVHTTMERRVECVSANARGYRGSGESGNGNDNDNDTDTDTENNNEKEREAEAEAEAAAAATRTTTTTTTISTAEKDGDRDERARKPLNVLIARRRDTTSAGDGDGEDEPEREPDLEALVRHVQEVNDRWFRHEQPLLTEDRISELARAFGVLAAAGSSSSGVVVTTTCTSTIANHHRDERKKDDDDNDDDDEKKDDDDIATAGADAAAATAPSPLPLDAAYRAMFTDAEREHLTFDLFLEDWEAFCEEEEEEEREREEKKKKKKDHKHKPNDPRQWVGYETALRFLEANQ